MLKFNKELYLASDLPKGDEKLWELGESQERGLRCLCRPLHTWQRTQTLAFSLCCFSPARSATVISSSLLVSNVIRTDNSQFTLQNRLLSCTLDLDVQLPLNNLLGDPRSSLPFFPSSPSQIRQNQHSSQTKTLPSSSTPSFHLEATSNPLATLSVLSGMRTFSLTRLSHCCLLSLSEQ